MRHEIILFRLHLLYISVMRQKAEILEKFYLIAGQDTFFSALCREAAGISQDCRRV